MAASALLGAVAAVAALKPLDYSRSRLEFADPRDVETAHGDSIGSLSWDTTPYVDAPELSSLRAFVRASCPGPTDREVALCFVDAMAERFPHAPPAMDAFDADYDVPAAFAAHFSGAPGHCVTRSSLAAAAMLSVGIPARVVQLLPHAGSGHNVFSFLDRQERRWIAVDPTYGVIVRTPGSTLASGLDGEAAFERVARMPRGVDASAEAVYANEGLFAGHVIYPEPWLYTRVGPRRGAFPYWGHFVVVGAPTVRMGILHSAFRGAAVVLALISLAFVGVALGAMPRALARLDRKARAPEHPSRPSGVEPDDVAA